MSDNYQSVTEEPVETEADETALDSGNRKLALLAGGVVLLLGGVLAFGPAANRERIANGQMPSFELVGASVVGSRAAAEEAAPAATPDEAAAAPAAKATAAAPKPAPGARPAASAATASVAAPAATAVSRGNGEKEALPDRDDGRRLREDDRPYRRAIYALLAHRRASARW